MTESTNKPRLVSVLYYVAGILYVPILYVLSIGPVAGLESCGVIPASVVLQMDCTVYAPLVWALEASPGICAVLVRYESLFVP